MAEREKEKDLVKSIMLEDAAKNCRINTRESRSKMGRKGEENKRYDSVFPLLHMGLPLLTKMLLYRSDCVCACACVCVRESSFL